MIDNNDYRKKYLNPKNQKTHKYNHKHKKSNSSTTMDDQIPCIPETIEVDEDQKPLHGVK